MIMKMVMMNACMNADVEGLPAYSHHDRFSPWWVFVRDDNGGNLSSDKIPPLTILTINHYLTQSTRLIDDDC